MSEAYIIEVTVKRVGCVAPCGVPLTTDVITATAYCGDDDALSLGERIAETADRAADMAMVLR